jgi:7-carboxy-7-deazaguanine synthase
MTYLVNEIFYSIQGEGYWTGRPAVFVRFSRCNLWTGREEDRAKAVCQFCDTDFLHANYRFRTAEALVDAIEKESENCRFVVLTGGEPTLQVDHALLDALNPRYYVAMETNGTKPVLLDIDWVCVSPKATAGTVVNVGHELKIVWPQPFDLEDIWLSTKFDHYWLSPMDGPNLAENTQTALDYVLAHPQWRLNIQTHKVIGVR